MSDFFRKVDGWKRFGRFTNSGFGLAIQGRFRKTVERLMLPLSRSHDFDRPLVRPERPPADLRVSLVTTTGIFVEGQEPFDVSAQKGDPSFRVIPADVDVSRLRIAHTHFTHSRAEKDINVIFPVERLRELAGEGAIGSVAGRLYSFGFDLHTEELAGPEGSAWDVARMMLEDAADVALLTPG